MLVPLAGKAFHIDDALFVTLAGHLVRHIFSYPFPPGVLHANPPGQFYVVAAALALFGESERALHLAVLPFTLLALWGMAALARELGVSGTAAALLLVCNACFLVSASTLMPDVEVLGFVLPAIALLWSDARAPSRGKLAACTLLFAVGWSLRASAFPVLLLAAGAQAVRGNRRALVPLSALVAAFVAFAALTQAHNPELLSYGRAVIGRSLEQAGWRAVSTLFALLFASVVALLALVLLPARGAFRVAELAGLALACAGLLRVQPWGAVAGLALLAAGRVDWAARNARRLSPDTIFLLLWAAGALLVPVLYVSAAAKFVNLALPPLLLLVLRAAPALRPARVALVAAAGLCVGVAVSIADAHLAAAQRDSLLEVAAAARATGATVWAGGHKWGPYLYARRAGIRFGGFTAEGEDTDDPAGLAGLRPGDLILDPTFPYSLSLPRGSVEVAGQAVRGDAFPVRVMSGGAGLWGSVWGSFPFVIDVRAPLVATRILRVRYGSFRGSNGLPLQPLDRLPPLEDDWVPRRW